MKVNEPGGHSLHAGAGQQLSNSPHHSDPWIVRKNWQDHAVSPLWTGSAYRSVTEPEPTPFRRSFLLDERFSEFRLAWQDSDYPKHIHLIGAFQVDRLMGVSGEKHDFQEEEEPLYNSIEFLCSGLEIQARMGNKQWTRIGRSDRPFRGCHRDLADCFLMEEALGKTGAELMIRFLHEDEEDKRKRKSLHHIHGIQPQPRPACTEVRDFLLRHAWDNLKNTLNPYSQLKGKLGMYDLPK